MSFLHLSTIDEVSQFSSEEQICGVSSSDNHTIIVSSTPGELFVYEATDKQIFRISVPLMLDNIAQKCLILFIDSTLVIYIIQYDSFLNYIAMSLPLNHKDQQFSYLPDSQHFLHTCCALDGVINPFDSSLIFLNSWALMDFYNNTLFGHLFIPSSSENSLLAISQDSTLELYIISFSSDSVKIWKLVNFSFIDPQDYFDVKNAKIIDNQYIWIPGNNTSMLRSKYLSRISLGFPQYEYKIAFFREGESKVMLTKSDSKAFFYSYKIEFGKMYLTKLLGQYRFFCNPGEIYEIKIGNEYYFYDQMTIFHESRTINANQTDPHLFYPSYESQQNLVFPKFYTINNQMVLWYNQDDNGHGKYRLARLQIAELYNPQNPDRQSYLSTQSWLLILSIMMAIMMALILVLLVVMIILIYRKLRRRQEQSNNQMNNISEQQLSKQRIQLTLAHPNISQ